MHEFVQPTLWMVAGLVLLVFGGELLVRGATAIATLVRIDPLVIGLTVVAFGTSAPELAVSVKAAYAGQSDLALGNVVGSNIANILLILGISSVIAPLAVASRLIRLDVPVMIGASVTLWLMSLDGKISQVDGAILFGAMIVYTVWLIFQSRKESPKVEAEFAESLPKVRPTVTALVAQFGIILAGLALLAVGSTWLVDGATGIARLFGVPQLIIGLTIVAIGTSLPELAASIMASVRGQRELAVGNCVGSNILNILTVLGLTGMVAPEGVPAAPIAVRVDIPIMIAVAATCLPIFFTGSRIARWEGAVFLFYYVAYTAYLIMVESNASMTQSFIVAIVGIAIPLTVLGLVVSSVQSARENRQGKQSET